MKIYYIYMTTNLINGMRYIGKHFGELNDSYLGSGTKLKKIFKNLGKNPLKEKFSLYLKLKKKIAKKKKNL